MRIVQVIDSLEVGGAERMAINYANALSDRIDFSGIVATRKEGNLKSQLGPKVDYMFLGKKSAIDPGAVWRLRNYFKRQNIGYVQPHSSSYFIVFLVKLIYPKIQIVWHDHNGLSEFLGTRKSAVVKIASRFFKGIIVVNYQLKNWAIRELHCSNVIYLPNFTTPAAAVAPETFLSGNPGKRILCLANLRDQKDHFFLLKIAARLMKSHPDWSFHLVGKDFEDDYSKRLRSQISAEGLDNHVFIYGTRNDTVHIIEQSDIAILTSKSEGLPVALLEYGLMRKPVVVTEVGEVPLIIREGKNGHIVPRGNVEKFHDALSDLIAHESRRNEFAEALYSTVMEDHSEDAIVSHYLEWLETH
jgi:glycosyltransferase involved in cell wall biosynthesis